MNHDDMLWIVMISDMRYIWVHPKWRCGSPMNILESLLRGVKDIPCRWLLRPLSLPWATERDDRTDSDGRNALQALGFALVLSRKKSSARQWRRAANSASSIVGGEIAWYYLHYHRLWNCKFNSLFRAVSSFSIIPPLWLLDINCRLLCKTSEDTWM